MVFLTIYVNSITIRAIYKKVFSFQNIGEYSPVFKYLKNVLPKSDSKIVDAISSFTVYFGVAIINLVLIILTAVVIFACWVESPFDVVYSFLSLDFL